MVQKTILHICILDKFIPPFVDFVQTNFKFDKQIFVLFGDTTKYPIKSYENIFHIKNVKNLAFFLKNLYKADKIILHSLFHQKIVKLLAIQPWLLKKCYWVMWGGDLYHYQLRTRTLKSNIYEAIRSFLIKRIGHIVTQIEGDYKLAQQWYGAKAKWHECFMYLSNTYKDYTLPPKQGNSINILVGNSADPTNNHVEIFEKLKPYKNQDIKIFCPLSYGSVEHAERMAKLGKELFGDKFSPLLNFMSFDKYLELLGQIDIAVFAHKRQQGMGNTTTLLGFGKKVYLHHDVTPWAFYSGLGVEIFDVDKLDLLPIQDEVAKKNKKIVMNYFSKKNLITQLKEIFK